MTNYRTLNVSGLESTHDTRGLRKMFESFGEIEDVRIERGSTSVTFVEADDARRAQMNMNGKTVDGKPILLTPRSASKPQRHAPTGTPIG